MDELIEPESHTWDVQLIRDIFNPIDADRILRIPLNENMTDDFVAWNLSKSDNYTVRSPYYAQWWNRFAQKVNHEIGQ